MKKWLRILRKVWKYKSFNYKLIETRKRNQRRLKRRKELLKKEGRCGKCGKQEDLTIDHIIPLSKGGAKHGMHNLQVLCKECNTRKGDSLAPPTNRLIK